MTTTKRATRATRSKLERALDLIESFLNAEDVDEVVTDREKANLNMAISEIQQVEGRLFSDALQRTEG